MSFAKAEPGTGTSPIHIDSTVIATELHSVSYQLSAEVQK